MVEYLFLSTSMLIKQSLYTIKYIKYKIRHNTTDSMKATYVQDDFTHFRYAKSRFFSNHVGYFFLLSLLYFAPHKYITEQWH